MTAKPCETRTFAALTLDPLHVGTGGYRLGHVDNTILRECGTNLPKVPGSSINGVLRAYTAMAVQVEAEAAAEASGRHYFKPAVFRDADGLLKLDCSLYRKMTYMRPVYVRLEGEPKERKIATLCADADGNPLPEINESTEKQKYESCAGKGGDKGEGHCGRSDCPICVAFGFSKGTKGGFQGLAQFYDMRILMFPVHSSIGPVWVTAPGVLQESGMLGEGPFSADIAKGTFKTTMETAPDRIYIGGYEYHKADVLSSFSFKPEFNLPSSAIDHLLVFDDTTFGRIVNDNLEVRTSVAINPETGAAEDGALFTYEAIPRATVLWFDVIYNRPEFFRINEEDIGFTLKELEQNITKGMHLLEALGIGGMNTRGMGRIRVLNLQQAEEESADE